MQGLGYCGVKRRPWFCVSLAEESLNLRSEMQGIGTSDLAYTSNNQEVPEPRDQENIANYVSIRDHTNWRPSARVLTYYSQGDPLGELGLDYTAIEFFCFDMGLPCLILEFGMESDSL